MSNDRELLEMAAKAVGIVLMWSSIDDLSPRRADDFNIWNPLTDDGDALRLAVKLELDVRGSMASKTWRHVIHDGATFSEVGQDAYSATRRAIVRAAAEIGRKMP